MSIGIFYWQNAVTMERLIIEEIWYYSVFFFFLYLMMLFSISLGPNKVIQVEKHVT
jgi:hypothetical protein